MSDFAVFRGRRVLVTGATGFKGSWLGLWLHSVGANVVGFSLPPDDERAHYAATKLDTRIHHVVGDVRDERAVRSVVGDFAPEFIFHLAAQPIVRVAYREPKRTFDTNIGGSVNLLEAVRDCDTVRAVVVVTSDKCYKNREWVWGYRENDELGGDDPYSASKAAVELVVESYRQSFFRLRPSLGVASARAGNVIGGGDRACDRIVPDCIRSLECGEALRVRCPQATRPWQHVLEPLSGYLTLAARLYDEPHRFAGPWNFGPDEAAMLPVGQLVARILAAWGSGEAIATGEDGPPEANVLHLSSAKARRELAWRPHWDVDRAVIETVRWYRDVAAGSNPCEVSLGQIKDFTSTPAHAAVALEC